MSDQALFAQVRAVDGDGYPASGATASFYASGTYTPITIYSDEAATIPLANPVTADANGAFPQVFTTTSAKCVVRNAAGSALYTLDPVPFARAAARGAGVVSFEPTEIIPETNVQDAIERVQSNAAAIVEALSATISATLGTCATKGFLDEDDFASNSATAAPSQQSTKAYINAAIPEKLNASGSAPVFACRAWVNFSGADQNGSYARSGTLVTVTMTAHGLNTGDAVPLTFTTGTATSGTYTITKTGANTFTVTDTVSGSTSGNVTRGLYIRAAGNISSITDNGTGAYTSAFSTAMPDVKYAVIGAATKENSGATTARIVTVLADTITVNGFSFRTETNNATNFDCEVVSLAIFR